jgi:hypothetical protein
LFAHQSHGRLIWMQSTIHLWVSLFLNQYLLRFRHQRVVRLIFGMAWKPKQLKRSWHSPINPKWGGTSHELRRGHQIDHESVFRPTFFLWRQLSRAPGSGLLRKIFFPKLYIRTLDIWVNIIFAKIQLTIHFKVRKLFLREFFANIYVSK